MGNIRTGDETFHQAWLPWITAVGKIIAKNEIGQGGVSNFPSWVVCGRMLTRPAHHPEPDRKRASADETFGYRHAGGLHAADREGLP